MTDIDALVARLNGPCHKVDEQAMRAAAAALRELSKEAAALRYALEWVNGYLERGATLTKEGFGARVIRDALAQLAPSGEVKP